MSSPPVLLSPGERVLWQGAPPRGLRLYKHDFELVPFSIAWAGFAVYWNVEVWRYPDSPGAWAARLWGSPFLLVGFYLVVGRFVVDAWVRRRQRYVVTDRRVMVLRSGWRGAVTAGALTMLPFVSATARRDGSGDLRFGPPRFKRSAKGRMVERDRMVPALDPLPRFIGIPNAVAVRALIERAITHAATSGY